MNCVACGHANSERTKFCLECGAPAVARCADCGSDLPPAAKFCGACGHQVAGAAPAEVSASPPGRSPRDYTPKHLADKILQSKSALEAERKQVTVMFADVRGSLELAEQLDPEEWHAILERFFEILTEGVHRFRMDYTAQAPRSAADRIWTCWVLGDADRGAAPLRGDGRNRLGRLREVDRGMSSNSK